MTVCELDKCAGCMACVDACPKEAITIQDSLVSYNAIIDEKKCVNCNMCRKVCQYNNPSTLRKPIEWHQGWAEDGQVRKNSSSGGAAITIAEYFLDLGGVVFACVFRDGKFIFDVARKKEELIKFAGSKYVKSNPIGAYKAVKDLLVIGEKVLFIGLPCQVSSMLNYVGEKLTSDLYTIDLICHGSPSPQILDIFLKQYKTKLSTFTDISFRIKAKYMVYGNKKGIITNGVSDRYSIAFINSLICTENCYSCRYAGIERVSDITLGDSWGSELPIQEQKKGISLVLCQTDKGKELLHNARLCLHPVDLKKAIDNNHQLRHPSIEHHRRKEFFKRLMNESFNVLVFKMLPKQCMRQDLKQLLLRLRVISN
ncbi:Coenzyme F420 hydrogenase/dehydrogenase, beta subunit C-terminal domain [Butyrivibrio sp. AE3004]|uniref:Coenzyme F420 hydrogenase/dehydrogenase, beta subunit C-terminal domain n=1 Tax=Butyrivibrio sp. AE3004 TaxID=1506994 RepID=UPI0004944E68|nr:Coenzyme F420 hydrogenase/dehydrogenase, beta subunit C-terminal domain [Butyrivibrio sp. AE3004]